MEATAAEAGPPEPLAGRWVFSKQRLGLSSTGEFRFHNLKNLFYKPPSIPVRERPPATGLHGRLRFSGLPTRRLTKKLGKGEMTSINPNVGKPWTARFAAAKTACPQIAAGALTIAFIVAATSPSVAPRASIGNGSPDSGERRSGSGSGQSTPLAVSAGA